MAEIHMYMDVCDFCRVQETEVTSAETPQEEHGNQSSSAFTRECGVCPNDFARGKWDLGVRSYGVNSGLYLIMDGYTLAEHSIELPKLESEPGGLTLECASLGRPYHSNLCTHRAWGCVSPQAKLTVELLSHRSGSLTFLSQFCQWNLTAYTCLSAVRGVCHLFSKKDFRQGNLLVSCYHYLVFISIARL